MQRAPEDGAWASLWGGRFELRAQLGIGSFGRVLRCYDHHTGQEVALKELRSFSSSSLLRFKKEFRALSDVQHPNLVRLYELFEGEGGQWAFTMELVPGSDFLSWVRPPGLACGYDENRLRSGLLQLTHGLSALHSLGMLHRDVKPENIRVTPEGRVVLLDFGLVTQLDVREQTTDVAGLGTAGYMAPEQVSQRVGAEADLYAVGALLYESLTGRLPFEGNAVAVLLEKTARVPVSPRTYNALIPEDLEGLCLSLLERDTARRASALDVLRVVGGEPRRSSSTRTTFATRSGLSLVGREGELNTLRDEWVRALQGDLRVVLIEGASGIGKTALMDEAVREFVGRRPDVLLLRGRCHAAEQVRYKLWDGVVDGLCKYLRSLSDAECRSILPARADYLPLLFPVLSRVKVIPPKDLQRARTDAVSERFAMFKQFGELLERVGSRCPLVICVDDIQWGDLDSIALLHVLLSLRPLPRLMMLATVRPLDELDAALSSKLFEIIQSSGCVSRLSLNALDGHASARLCATLLNLAPEHKTVQKVVQEAGGNPWCALQMVQCFAEGERETDRSLDLDTALRLRVESLGQEARRVAELLAIAGGPAANAVLRHALAVEGALLEQSLSVLRAHRLVRAVSPGTWVCYHDRVREALEAGVPPAVGKTMHAALAHAFRREGGPPERIAAHFRAADEPELALPWLERAADAAEQASAFSQAAAIYEDVLGIREKRGESASALHPLRMKLADVLSFTGRGAESARVLLSLLKTAPREERPILQLRAAEQLLRAGEAREGIEAARVAFDALAMPWPKSPTRALARTLIHRLILRARGNKVKLRAEPLSKLSKSQLDALLRLNLPLSWVDLLRSGELSLRYLRASLDGGDRDHLARALLGEGMMAAIEEPGGPKASDLLNQAEALIERSSSPSLEAFKYLARGSSQLSYGEPLRAVATLRHAQTIIEEKCPTEIWQLSNVRSMYLPARLMTGHHRSFLVEAERWYSEAKLRGDTFGVTTCVVTGAGYTRHLIRDAPSRALAEVDAAMVVWQGDTFGLQHCFAFTAKQVVLCYGGGTRAFEVLDAEWPRARASVLFRIGFTREILLTCYGIAALSACVAEPKNRRFQDVLSSVCRDLSRARTHFGRTNGGLLRAQTAWLRGDLARALELARTLEEEWASAGIYNHRHAALLVSSCTHPEHTKEKLQALCEWLQGEGWANPHSAIQMVLPIYPLLLQLPATRAAGG